MQRSAVGADVEPRARDQRGEIREPGRRGRKRGRATGGRDDLLGQRSFAQAVKHEARATRGLAQGLGDATEVRGRIALVARARARAGVQQDGRVAPRERRIDPRERAWVEVHPARPLLSGISADELDQPGVARVARERRGAEPRAVGRKPPGAFARERPGIADAARCAGQAPEDAALQQTVEVEHQVEARAAKHANDAPNLRRQFAQGETAQGPHETQAWEDERPIDRTTRFDRGGGARLDEPADLGCRIQRTQRVDGWERTQDIAQCPQPDHQDAIRRRCLREGVLAGRNGWPRRARWGGIGYPGMRIARTLSGQVVRETLLYSTLGFLAILALLTSQNLVRRLDELTMIGFEPGDFWIVLRSLLPMLATYATPVAFLLGVMLTLRRMSTDHEVLAMRSCGLGLASLLVPILALGVVISGLTLYLMTSVEHAARNDLVNVFKRTATKGGILEPGRFRMIGPRMFFVEGRDRDNRLEGVMIDDHSNGARPLRIFAERGQLSFDADRNTLRFVLEQGDVHFRPTRAEPDTYRRMSFDRFDYTFDISTLLGDAFSATRPRQMSIPELDAIIERADAGDPLDGLDERDPVAYRLERARRFALPMAPLLFGLIALPLGVREARGGRAWGVLLCIAIVLAYYALLAGGQQAARQQLADPTLCLWLPNVLFGAITLCFFGWERFGGRG